MCNLAHLRAGSFPTSTVGDSATQIRAELHPAVRAAVRAVALTVTGEGRRVIDRAIDIVRELQQHLTAPLGGTGSRRMQALMHDLELLIAAPAPSTDQARKERGHD